MARISSFAGWMPMLLVVASACGGGDKPKEVKKPTGNGKTVKNDPPPAPETEEDRQQKRIAAANAIVPDGSSCLPASFKEPNAPRLELAAVGEDAMVCATDVDQSRLLGPIACWKVNLDGGALSYVSGVTLPGHSVSVRLDDRCARGYCVPAESKPANPVVHMAMSYDSKKAAVLAGDNVHIFDVASKAHESTFSIRGDKGVTNDPIAIHWVGDAIFVEGADQGPNANIWVFKPDGTQVGPITSMGKDAKPLSTYGGSFVVLDGDNVGVAEQGFATLTEYAVADGKRTKHVRNVKGKSPCKPNETTDYWAGKTESLPPKCAEFMTKNYAHLQGADLLAGKNNFLVLLRGPRLGELAVMDKKSLAEKKVLKLPWCDAGGGAAAEGASAPAPTE